MTYWQSTHYTSFIIHYPFYKRISNSSYIQTTSTISKSIQFTMKNRQIATWVVAGAVMSAMFTACKKSDDTLPAIGGYNSSSEVASTNLVAFWPFDGNYTETKQNLTGTNNGASFTTGVNGQGQAYQGKGSSNIFLNNPGTAFAQLKSVSISAWIAEPTQPVNNTTTAYAAGQGAQGIFFVYDQTGAAWNLLHFNVEPDKADTLRVHAGFNNTGAPEWQGIVPEARTAASVGTNQWIHYVMTYDGSSSTYVLYRNGIAVPVNSAWGKSAQTQVWTNGNKTTPMGNLNFKSPPAGIVIGAFPQAVTPTINSSIGGPQPWSGNFQGAIDNLRIYNKALTQAEVGALYGLEGASR